MGSKAREFCSKIPVYQKIRAQYIDITSKSTKERSNTTAEKIDKKKTVRYLPKPPIVGVIEMCPSQLLHPLASIYFNQGKRE